MPLLSWLAAARQGDRQRRLVIVTGYATKMGICNPVPHYEVLILQ
jgi:hypothetical protein